MFVRHFAFAVFLNLILLTAAQAQVQIGLGAPMTGEQATFGAQMKNGAELAVDEINSQGGVLGQKVVLHIGDDRADPKEGLSVANKFIGDDVTFVVGHLQSGVSIPASKEYADAGVFTITPGATNPQLTDSGLWNTHRVCGRDDQQGKVAGEFLAKNFAGKKIAILHDRTTYGKGLADETKKALNANSVTEVFFDGINVAEKDFTAVVSRLKSLNVDYVYFGGLHTPAALLLRQMRDQGMNTVLVSGDALVTDEFAAIAGDAAVGTLATFGPDPLKNQASAKVVEAFKAKGLAPESYALYTYAGFEVIAQGIAAAKSTDPKKVAEAVRSGQTFHTVLGSLNFDKKGDLSVPNYVIYEWTTGKDGKIIYGERK